MSDELAAELAARCPALTALELSDTAVGDAGLQVVAEAYGGQLRELTLNYSRRWGPRGVAALATRCAALRHFSAAASPGLDDASLSALGAGCPQLAYVRVDRCAHVSLDGVMRLVNRCPGVRLVAMAGIHCQSSAEQQAAFGRWAAQRGLRFDAPAGLLAAPE